MRLFLSIVLLGFSFSVYSADFKILKNKEGTKTLQITSNKSDGILLDVLEYLRITLHPETVVENEEYSFLNGTFKKFKKGYEISLSLEGQPYSASKYRNGSGYVHLGHGPLSEALMGSMWGVAWDQEFSNGVYPAISPNSVFQCEYEWVGGKDDYYECFIHIDQ